MSATALARRSRLTNDQYNALMDVFDTDTQPTMDQRVALAAQLGMETKQVSSWFQNRRQKIKHAPPSAYDLQTSSPPTFEIIPHRVMHPSLTHQPSIRVIPDQEKVEDAPDDEPFRHSYSPRPLRTSLRARTARNAANAIYRDLDSPSPPPRGHTRSSSASTVSDMYASPKPKQHRNTAGTTRSRVQPSKIPVLLEIYAQCPSPSMEHREKIARELGMSKDKVTNWFRNQRQHERRKRLETEASGVTALSKQKQEEQDVIIQDPDQASDDEEDEEEVMTPEPDALESHPSTPPEHPLMSPSLSPSVIAPIPLSGPTKSLPVKYADEETMEGARLLLYFSANFEEDRFKALVNHPK